MEIIGHQKTSFIDYPDKICTVYFTAGCNFRCPYCHNAHIVKGEGQAVEESEIFDFLERRKKFIDGVCISGGEPTLHEDLPGAIEKIKNKGFLVKLDTNGTNPNMLQEILSRNLLDYIAMDIKAPWHKYKEIAGVSMDVEAVQKSVQIIRDANNIDYEFRTTVCRELLLPEDILEIAEALKGSKRYIIQNFRDTETVLGGAGKLHAYDKAILEEMGDKINSLFNYFKIR